MPVDKLKYYARLKWVKVFVSVGFIRVRLVICTSGSWVVFLHCLITEHKICTSSHLIMLNFSHSTHQNSMTTWAGHCWVWGVETFTLITLSFSSKACVAVKTYWISQIKLFMSMLSCCRMKQHLLWEVMGYIWSPPRCRLHLWISLDSTYWLIWQYFCSRRVLHLKTVWRIQLHLSIWIWPKDSIRFSVGRCFYILSPKSESLKNPC